MKNNQVSKTVASLPSHAGTPPIRRARDTLTAFLSEAGITVNGPNPWDIQVHDDSVFDRVLAKGNLGLGEALSLIHI